MSFMEKRAFHKQLAELIREIDCQKDPERLKLEPLVVASPRFREKGQAASLGCLQGSIDHLRVLIQYLLFDVEALRRERDVLRRAIADTAEPPTEQEHD